MPALHWSDEALLQQAIDQQLSSAFDGLAFVRRAELPAYLAQNSSRCQKPRLEDRGWSLGYKESFLDRSRVACNGAPDSPVGGAAADSAPPIHIARPRVPPLWLPRMTGTLMRAAADAPGAADGADSTALLAASYFVLPRGLAPHDRIIIVDYDLAGTLSPPVPLMMLGDMAHVKLGGVMLDILPAALAWLVYFISGVRIHAADLFRRNLGIAALLLGDPQREAPLVIERLSGRVWMAPHCAYVATTPAAAAYLREHVRMVRDAGGACHRLFPRHILTVDHWQPRPRSSKVSGAA